MRTRGLAPRPAAALDWPGEQLDIHWKQGGLASLAGPAFGDGSGTRGADRHLRRGYWAIAMVSPGVGRTYTLEAAAYGALPGPHANGASCRGVRPADVPEVCVCAMHMLHRSGAWWKRIWAGVMDVGGISTVSVHKCKAHPSWSAAIKNHPDPQLVRIVWAGNGCADQLARLASSLFPIPHTPANKVNRLASLMPPILKVIAQGYGVICQPGSAPNASVENPRRRGRQHNGIPPLVVGKVLPHSITLVLHTPFLAPITARRAGVATHKLDRAQIWICFWCSARANSRTQLTDRVCPFRVEDGKAHFVFEDIHGADRYLKRRAMLCLEGSPRRRQSFLKLMREGRHLTSGVFIAKPASQAYLSVLDWDEWESQEAARLPKHLR